jgi:spheroidene monooxygenase
MNQAISLSLFRFSGAGGAAWAFSQMGLSRGGFGRIPGIGFAKMFGTGTGEGFTPVPNLGVYGLMATWPDLNTAQEAIERAPVYRRYRDHAVEDFTVHLEAISARGAWDGDNPFVIHDVDGPPPLPMAVLTRATVKPRHVVSFWRAQPDISEVIGNQPHMLFKIGMGEVPWFQQVTFSIWDDVEAMKTFAHKHGPHADAIRKVRDNRWFAEELYARFRVTGHSGQWDGQDPLARSKSPDAPAVKPGSDMRAA